VANSRVNQQSYKNPAKEFRMQASAMMLSVTAMAALVVSSVLSLIWAHSIAYFSIEVVFFLLLAWIFLFRTFPRYLVAAYRYFEKFTKEEQ
jgi:hypothetical protein